MTSPVEEVRIICPSCAATYTSATYTSWTRGSVNLTLDNFDETYLEQMSTARCPACGHVVGLETLVTRLDGTWEVRR